ncbi:MAG: hypothetical protein WD208_09110 [Dehalococcoidia bacterium]
MLFVFLAVLLVAALAVGGLVAVWLADEPEDGLFLKGMGYAFMGNFLINIGPLPLPVTQVIGAVMAARSETNSRSRWAAWGVGLALRVVPFLLSPLF